MEQGTSNRETEGVIELKTTKSPLKINKSIALIIPDAFVKSYQITTKSRLTLISSKEGFRVKVKR